MSSNLNNPEEIFRNLAAQFGLKVTSARRTPGQNAAAGGAKASHHLNGTALDVSGDPAKMREFTKTVQRDYGSQLSELFHDPVGAWKRGQQIAPIGGHSDHVHVAWGGGSAPRLQPRTPQTPQGIDTGNTPAAQPSILDSLLNQEEPPMYRQIINEVMGTTGADEPTARAYLDHPEGKKRFPMAQEASKVDQILRDPTGFLPPASKLDIGGAAQQPDPLAPVAAPAKVAPQAKPAGTAAPKVSRSTNSVDNRVKILQTRVSALDEQLKQDYATRERLIASKYPTEQFDKAIFDKNAERQSLLGEIGSVKTKGAPKVADLQAKLTELESARNTAQQAGAQSTDEREQKRLYDQANQSNAKIQSLKKIIGTEQAGGVTHPLMREAVARPNRDIQQPTTWEQIQGGAGAGAAGAFATVDNLVANVMNAVVPTSGDTYKLPGEGVIDPSQPQTARERAEDYKRLQQVSAEGAGPGLTPALASAAAQAGLTYPLFRGAGALGTSIAGTVGAPALLGEAAAMGGYGALEHAHEGNPEIAKAAALNALLPLAGGALKNFSAPTRIAGEFASGFAPTVAMGGTLEEGLAQGLTGAGMAAAGGGRGKDEPNTIAEINRKVQENPNLKFEDFAPHEQEALFNHYEKNIADSIAAKLEQGNTDLTPHEQAFIQKYGGIHDSAQPIPENNQQQTGVKAQTKTDEEIAQAVESKLQQSGEPQFTPEELDFIQRQQSPAAPPVESAPVVRAPQAPLDVNIRAGEVAPEPAAPRAKDGPAIKPKEQTLEQALKFNERVLNSMDRAFPEKVAEAPPSSEPVKNAENVKQVEIVENSQKTKNDELTPPVNQREFIVGEKPVTVTDPESIAAYDTAKAKYEQAKERARGMSDKQSAGKANKAAGMQFAADKRRIANMMTVKEAARANQERRAADKVKLTRPPEPTVGEPWIDPTYGEVRQHAKQDVLARKIRVVDSAGTVRMVEKPTNTPGAEVLSKPAENITKTIPENPQVKEIKQPTDGYNITKESAKPDKTNTPRDMVQAIRDLGGMKMNERTGEQDRLRESRLKQPGVFRKDGQSYDQMAQRLHDEGYLDAPDTREMFEKLDRAASGEKLQARTEEAQNAQADVDAEAFANRPIEEKQNVKPNKSDESKRDTAAHREQSGMVPQSAKPITAEAPAESPRLAEARTRFEDAQGKLQELNRRAKKGENVTMDIEEQARVTQRAKNQLTLLEKAEVKAADLEGAQRAATETFSKGETPKVSDLMSEYKLSYDDAYKVVTEGAKARIQEKFKSRDPLADNPNIAKTRDGLPSARQNEKNFRESAQRGIDGEEYARELYGIDYQHLTKAKAAEFTDKLKSLTRQEAREIQKRQRVQPEEPKLVQDARARLRQGIAGNQLSSNPGRALVDSAIVTGYDIYKGTKDFAAWSKEMIAKLGDKVKPILEDLHARMDFDNPTKTPEFKKFFEGSQVIGEDGEPLIVYHGTNTKFKEFDANFLGGHYGEREGGFSFGSEGEADAVANDFEGNGKPRVLPVYLSIKKPADLSELNLPVKQRASEVYDRHRSEIIDTMEAQDADGIIIKSPNGEDNFYLVRNPEQIKSIKNKGSFDPDSPSLKDGYPAWRKAAEAKLNKQAITDKAAEKGLYGETLTPEQQKRIEDRQATEGGFLGAGKPKLINLARAESDKGAAGFNRFKLKAAAKGFTDAAEIRKAWDNAQDLPPIPTVGDALKEGLNIPKTLEATGEVSMLLRQGGILTAQHPMLAGKAIARAVRSLKPSSFENFKTEIDTHPRAKQMEDAGLYLSNRETGDTSMNAREEAFMSKVIGKIPIVGKLHEATERLNTTYLDQIRMDAFNQYADLADAKKGGEADYKVAADFINNLSGRGSIHESLKKFEPYLNGTLFSPRFLTSRLRVLNPVSYAKMYKESPIVARKAMTDMAKYMAVVGTTLTLAKLGGADVSLNPDEADFLKIKLGDTRFDMLSGLQQPLRLALRLGLRGVRAANGTEVKDKDKALPILLQFGRTKLSPIAGYLVNADQGKNMVGEKFDFKSDTAKLFLPLYYKDLYDAYQQEGLAGTVKTGVPGFVGIGTQSYKKKGTGGSSAGALKF